MDRIINEVIAAQQNPQKLNRLISKYLPFIKKQITGLKGLHLEYDDMLSLAMLTFSGCVGQYSEKKGNFLSFCSVCIRNRIVDESRKQSRYDNKTVPLFDDPNPEDTSFSAEGAASIASYNMENERLALVQEIEMFSKEIEKFGINFEDLPQISPKQARSRELCFNLAKEIIDTPAFRQELMSTQRIPQTELSSRFSISPKTVEKHRKFIVVMAILLAGEYPYIQSFLPMPKEVRQ